MYSRLKQFRESLGLTQAEFGSSIGIAKTTYNNYEIGVREPKSDFWIAIAQKYNVTIDYLMGFSDNPHTIDDNVSSSAFTSKEEIAHIKKYRALDEHGKRIVDMVTDEETARMVEAQQVQELEPQNSQMSYINCYDLAVSAGIGEPWSSDYGYKTRLEIPTYQVPENTHYCARVNGDSMEPAYKDGDIVFVQHLDGESVRVGEVGVFALNGDGYIKKLGEGALESLNPKYSPIVIREHDDLRCQGRVLGKI